MEDPRFSAALSRPHFQQPSKDVSKVVLDERFASVLTDSRFQLQEKDRYGRKQKKKERVKEELSAFYTIEDKDESQHDDDENDDDDEVSDDQQEQLGYRDKKDTNVKVDQDPSSRIAYLTALSRGELEVSSSSSDDDDDEDASASSDDDNEAETANERSGSALDPSAKEDEIEITHEPSPYLAVLNLDWEHVRAEDIFAIMASFTPPGAVKRVRVYPSDFGMEQMAKEEKFGPVDIWKNGRSPKGKGQQPVDNEEDEEEEVEEELAVEDDDPVNPDWNKTSPESDFDPEKLRAYEIAKLKYYFAVVEFASPEHANIAYKELDGQEFEHSSAEMDLRAIPPADLDGVIQNRKLRDEATSLSGNYQPPDFVVNALQQTAVQCTWEDGDVDREKTLTKYSAGQVGAWNALAEHDDIRAYLASDQSSDDDSEVMRKAATKRSVLGLDSDDEQDNSANDERNESSSSSEENSDESDDEQDSVNAKEITYAPGSNKLEEKIRSKLQSKDEEPDELTPWQKYQEKRKQKKKERRQAARNLRKEKVETSEDDMQNENDGDDFFVDAAGQEVDLSKSNEATRNVKKRNNTKEQTPKNAEELELLLAGDGDGEDARDFDIRGLQRIEKNKDKKLCGTRKRKELAIRADVTGKDFKVDVKDSRFSAVLDGADGRFGIDRTDPNFKETPAMQEILEEQMKRRKTKKRKQVVAPNTDADSSDARQGDKSSGATALTALVTSLKSRVCKVSQ